MTGSTGAIPEIGAKQLLWEEEGSRTSPWPAAVVADPFVFISGILPVDPESGRVLSGRDESKGSSLGWAGTARISAQITFLYDRIQAILRRLGASQDDILLINGWLADFREWPAMNRIRGREFSNGNFPPSTTFGVPGVGLDGARALFEALALLPREGVRKQPLGSNRQVGFYYPGSQVGPFIFLAGDVAADPERGLIVRGYDDLGPAGASLATGQLGPDGWEGPIRAQSWFIYERIRKLLEEAGSSLQRILKQTIYLRDPHDLPAFGEISRSVFGDRLPPTTVVQVDDYGRREFLVEIEVTAATAATDVRLISIRPEAPAAASQVGPFIFLSGLLGVDPATSEVTHGAPGVASQGELAALQTGFIYDQAAALLGGEGLDITSLVRQVVYYADPAVRPSIERVAAARTRKSPPATTLVPVRSLWPAPAQVLIDFTAVRER